METKRLFVGGLFSDIKEEDLRARFTSFGTVSSVEIVRRADDEGHSLKTFAYLNIKQTETDFKRCISLLNNTKWKGCCLKIQAAKESFLSKLSRERQEDNQAKLDLQHNVEDKNQRKEQQTLSVIPETLPKAVPGTPIPGYKNWVVGKFARVLPVVYLRRRDGKKIAKFDPSKTTHCLKRLKTEEMQESAASELTWSLDTEVPISNGVASKSKTNSKQEGDETRANSKIDVVQDEAKKSIEGQPEKRGNNNYSSESSSWDSESSSLDGEVNTRRPGNLVKSSSCNLEGQIPLKVHSENATTSPNLSKISPVPTKQSKVLQNEAKSLSNTIELNGSKHKIHSNGVLRKLPKSTREVSDGVDKKNVDSSSDSSVESTDENGKSGKNEGKPNVIELKGSKRKRHTNGVLRKLPKSTCEVSDGVDKKSVANSSDSSDDSTDEKAKSGKNEGKPNAIQLKGSKHKKHTNGVLRKLPKSTCEVSDGEDKKNVASSSERSDESTDEKAKSGRNKGKPNAIKLKGSKHKKHTNDVLRKLPKSTCEVSDGEDKKNVASSSESSDESTDEKGKSGKNEGKPNAIELKGSKRLKQTIGGPRKLSKSSGEFSVGVDKKTVVNSRKKETVSSESSDESMDGNLSEEESASSRIKGPESDSASTKAESFSFGNGRSISQSGDKKPARKLSSVREEASRSFSEDLTVDNKESKILSQLLGDKIKQKLSNDKRLDALMEKRKSVAAHKDIIKDALKDLDISKRSHDGKKHIVFDDDDDNDDNVEDEDGDSVKEKTTCAVHGKISGSQASSWLGLDNDSDEEDAQMIEDCHANLVREKPHFEGKAGEELFKLQRRFGGDKRFDLNERFLESDDESEVADGDNHVNAENDHVESKDSTGTHDEEEEHTSMNLRQEKEMELKVLGSILGEDLRLEFGEKEIEEKNSRFRSSEAVRYDPTREDHKQFEQEKKKPEKKEPEKKKKEEKKTKKNQQEQDQPMLPEVSQERYHSVESTSLSERFANKNQGSSGFSFLFEEPQQNNDSPNTKHGDIGAAEELIKNPFQSALQLPYDSSGESEEGEGEGEDDTIVDTTVPSEGQPFYSSKPFDEMFFFHPGDPQLVNRINDEFEPFMRTGSIDDVRSYWESVRADLKNDYKYKQRSAERMQRKLRAKRTRIR